MNSCIIIGILFSIESVLIGLYLVRKGLIARENLKWYRKAEQNRKNQLKRNEEMFK